MKENNDMAGESKNRKKVSKRVFSAAVWLLVAAMILLAVYFIYCHISGRVAFVDKYATVRIISPSMEPTIPTGTFILVEKVGADEIREGDVILFLSRDPQIQGKLNTHRVVEVVHDGNVRHFVTRGDNAAALKDKYPVYDGDVVGRYVRNCAVMTAISRFFQNPFAYFLLILIPCAVVLLFSARNLFARLREARVEELVAAEVERMRAEDQAKEKMKEKTDPIGTEKNREEDDRQ